MGFETWLWFLLPVLSWISPLFVLPAFPTLAILSSLLFSCKLRIANTLHMYMLSYFSHVQLFATPTVSHQAPLSMGFSRQEYWSGCHALLQGIFSTQGLNPHLLCLLHWQVGFFFFLSLAPPGKPLYVSINKDTIKSPAVQCLFLNLVLHLPRSPVTSSTHPFITVVLGFL